MKTAFFTLIILFSFVQINAQDSTNKELNTVATKLSKIDFYKALVEKNNFDITIKEVHTNVIETATKSDFYELLIQRNNFDIQINKDILLTHAIEHNKMKKAKTTHIVGLAP